MTLQFYNAYKSIEKTPKESYDDNVQAQVDAQFTNSSTIETIGEEKTFGTQIYTDLLARVVTIFNPKTGRKEGNDWRRIIFQSPIIENIGYRYEFDSNIWLSTNDNSYGEPTSSVITRRCNNVWRYRDVNGNLVEEPCVVDYSYSGNQFEYKTSIITVSGDALVVMQANDITKLLKINDRTILNGQAFKINGIYNFGNNQTFDSDSYPLVYLDVFKDVERSEDDLVNNIPEWIEPQPSDPTPTDGIFILPNVVEIGKDEEVSYAVYNYVSGVQQADVFTYGLSGADGSNYEFTNVDGNNFKVKSLGHDYTKLKVTCTTGVGSEDIDIQLNNW
jgi:hypothetical protein